MSVDLDEGDRLLALYKAASRAIAPTNIAPANTLARGWLLHWLEVNAEALLRAARERDTLREALRDDPAKWSFWTLTTIARLILTSDYPPDVFTGTSGDPGAAFVVKLREALDALAAAPGPEATP